jgi:outer membrane receptor protein involved in Fe transport
LRAAFACAIAIASVVGPISAATTGSTIVAQAGQGTISGHVTDQRGAPLANAQVSVEGSGGRASTTTGADGAYTLSVPPGLYTLTINKGGFRTAQQTDVTVTNSTLSVDVTMVETNLQSLQIIGRTSAATANTATFNISESAVQKLPDAMLSVRQNNNITDTIATLPGVVAQRTFSATPNTDFIVRGGAFQTRVTIDGHLVSTGTAGQWNTNYAAPGIFSNADVVKGAGLNGAIAGESVFGTVNLRTRDFSPTNTAGLQLGIDNYNGGFYNAFADVNFFNDKASLIVQKTANFFNGPWANTNQQRAAFTAPAAQNSLAAVPSYPGLTQWTGDFTNNYQLEAELAKIRYRFSESTSVTFEFLGLQGQYYPQGGAYAAYDGQMTIGACENTSGAGTGANGASFSTTVQPTLATCTTQSKYTAPYTFGQIGQVVPAYTWFPNSFIQNNEPHFMAEFRTSLGNDTILFRPYTQVINRFISGAFENQYAGNGGSWYAVTNVANCQAKFLAPGTTGGGGGPAVGAAGPCFPNQMTPTSPAYIGADATPFLPATTTTAPACSVAAPCWTSNTAQQNNGIFAYGTPFSQPEVDRLNGYTFSWIHPFGNNVINFNIDWRKDYVQFFSGDTTLPAPGCSYVIGAASGTAGTTVANSVPAAGLVAGTPYQPTCTASQLTGPYAQYNILPRSPISTPPTDIVYTDFSLTGQFQLTPKLSLALGNYLELGQSFAQTENPTVLANYAAAGNAGASPVALVSANSSWAHFDPHVGLEYRMDRNLSLRGSFGTAITPPYGSQISGFGSVTIPNAANNQTYQLVFPNSSLKPEVSVAYDGGLDWRTLGGAVLSADLYQITTHNVFLTNLTPFTPPAPFTANAGTISTTINGPLQKFYGAEVSLLSQPRVGFGYWLTGTLQRVFYDQLPSTIYTTTCTVVAGACTNVPNSTNGNITGAQLVGYPYFKSYDSVFYNGPHGEQYWFGMDWEGANNFTYGPAYLTFDMSLKYPIGGSGKFFAQLTAQNLFYTNTNTLLGRTLQSQGFSNATAYINPVTGQVFTNSSQTNPLQALPTPTFRFSLGYGL